MGENSQIESGQRAALLFSNYSTRPLSRRQMSIRLAPVKKRVDAFSIEPFLLLFKVGFCHNISQCHGQCVRGRGDQLGLGI